MSGGRNGARPAEDEGGGAVGEIVFGDPTIVLADNGGGGGGGSQNAGKAVAAGVEAPAARPPTSHMPRLNESSAWLLTQHAERTRVRNRIAALQAEADSLAHEIADLMDTDRAMTAGIERLEEMQNASVKKESGDGSE